MNSKPRRAQGGLGILSHTISVQSLQESIPKILSLERKKGGREEREEAPGGDDRWFTGMRLAPEAGKEERGERLFNPLTLD